MDNSDRFHQPSGALTVPHLPPINRADVLGTTPVCVGTRLHATQVRESPTAGLTIGVPLYARSRSASRSPSPSPQNDEDQNQNESHCDERAVENQESGGQDYGTCPCASAYTPSMEDAFRRKLRFYFMNPCQKWRAKRRFPYKLCLQVLKILIVTMQLMRFGMERSNHVEFLRRNKLAFHHLFVYNWTPDHEVPPYPPATGIFAVYRMESVYDGIDYTLKKYNLTKEEAIGTYEYAANNGSMPPLEMCITQYKRGEIWPHNQSYNYDSTINHDCFYVSPVNTSAGEKYDIRQFLTEHDKELNFDRLIKLELKFSLKTMHLKTYGPGKLTKPNFFRFDIVIVYLNTQHDGQVPVYLKADAVPLDTRNGTIQNGASIIDTYDKTVLDVSVIVVGCISFLLCLRTIYRANRLRSKTVHFFKFRYNKEMSCYDQCDFLNLWDVLILVNDILTVGGTVMKTLVELNKSEEYELACMFLGIGNLLVWLGVLRYLTFFEHYNILILTMKQAIPDILRFLVCAAVIYLGFTFCGWIVLGPYHIKFSTLSKASECLFALVNGDEIFVTYSDTREGNQFIFWFSRVYLYLFISVFMYVVYSLFTSIIITTYETIKFYYRVGFPKSELQLFIDEHVDDVNSPLFLADEQGHSCLSCLFPCFSCCKRRNTESYPNEYTALIN